MRFSEFDYNNNEVDMNGQHETEPVIFNFRMPQ